MKITDLLKHLDDAARLDSSLDRKAFLEVSLAAELAFAVTLPSGPVASVVAYFEEMHASQVKRVISEVNELFPIGIITTYNVTVDCYKARYALCHEPRLLTAQDIGTMVNRPAVGAALTDAHRTALFGQYACTLRSGLADYITRYVAPTQA
jgi:hypothetical protein